MEIKIGITDVPREVAVETDATREEVEAQVREALASPDPQQLLTLTDNRGRTVLVPTRRVAYVDLGAATPRQVGFGAL